MIHSIKNLIGYTIGATDGEIGKVKDFYFDDTTWTIRYVIVETGSLLFKQKVLISAEALLPPDWEKEIFLTSLSIQQIENSPNIDTEKPVSRQQEIELHKHYSWEHYWNSLASYKDDNLHLRSIAETASYHVRAIDGEAGNVENFLIDDETWKLNFIVVDAFTWFPAKRVLISPKQIKEINQNTTSIIINAALEKIKNSPEYYTDQTISQAYEISLADYYASTVL